MGRLTTVSHTDARATPGFVVTGRSDGPRAFRRARRHSRLVRILRVAIPAGIVLSILGVIGVATVLDPLRALAKLPIDLAGLVVSGTKITMQQPRLAGYTNESRPYLVTARTAAQDITKPDVLELQDLRATLEMKDAAQIELKAKSGIYQTKADTLTLQEQILITSATYEGVLTEAVINVRTGHAVSEKPVELKMPQGQLNANRMEIFNSGDVIRFENGITLVLTPDSTKPGTQASKQ
jgi:lipopolysaccharide export system protein LptC